MKLLFFLLSLQVVLSQTPAHSQTAVLITHDSTQVWPLPSQQYDFYYSAHQADTFLKTSLASYVQADKIKKNTFRDKTFTEVVAKGLPLKDDFDDYVLIGSGTLNEVKQTGDW